MSIDAKLLWSCAPPSALLLGLTLPTSTQLLSVQAVTDLCTTASMMSVLCSLCLP